jgi:hypothetical protein
MIDFKDEKAKINKKQSEKEFGENFVISKT